MTGTLLLLLLLLGKNTQVFDVSHSQNTHLCLSIGYILSPSFADDDDDDDTLTHSPPLYSTRSPLFATRLSLHMMINIPTHHHSTHCHHHHHTASIKSIIITTAHNHNRTSCYLSSHLNLISVGGSIHKRVCLPISFQLKIRSMLPIPSWRPLAMLRSLSLSISLSRFRETGVRRESETSERRE